MTDYRRQMLEEMEVRGFDHKTVKVYIRAMERFMDFFGGKPESASADDIKKYQRYLRNERGLAPNSVNGHICGIRFYYRQILGRHQYVDLIPKIKVPSLAPVVLSEQEIASMITSVNKIFYKAVITLMYSSGLRNEELRNLKTVDIDSARMVIHVRSGKGRRDRQAILSQHALDLLRRYWRECRLDKPKSDWLFIPSKTNTGNYDKPLSATSIGYMLNIAANAAGVKKKFIPTY